MTDTLLAVAYEISDGLSALPWWAGLAWLALLFAGVLRPGIKASMGE